MTEKRKPTRTAVRVVVLLLIVVAVLGIFFIKKALEEKPAAAATPPAGAGEALPLEITSVDLDNILSHGLPVMIDFGADECGPCQAMAPALEQMHAEAQGAAVIHYIDVWVHTEAAEGYPIRVVPTQVFILPDGTPYQPTEGLAEEIGVEFTSYSSKDTGELVYTVHEGGLAAEQIRAILVDMGAAL